MAAASPEPPAPTEALVVPERSTPPGGIPRQLTPEHDRLVRRDLLVLRLEVARGRRRPGTVLRRALLRRSPEAP